MKTDFCLNSGKATKASFREGGAAFFADAWEWSAGRSPWGRILLWGCLLWIFLHHLRDPLYSSWFGGLNLGIHELGHVVAIPLGISLQIAAGTLAQCLAPFAAFFVFHRQRDYFAIGFTFCWLGINLFEVATYAEDALAQQLPLVSPFAGVPIHDWNFLLGKLGLLGRAAEIARLFRFSGAFSFLIGLAFTAWLIVGMLRTRRPPPGSHPFSL